MTPHLLLDIVVPATNAQEAQAAARAWAAAEPKIRLDRVTRVRPNGDPWGEKWTVEIAYSASADAGDQGRLGL